MSTLKQVAAAAGVHLTTVAAILNQAGGNTRAGEATRRKVTAIAQRLGYVRNESAWRLRTGRSDTVGFIGGDLRNPFFSELASALEREAEERRFHLVVSHVSPAGGASVAQAVENLRRQTISRIVYWDESPAAKPVPGAGARLVPIGFTTRPRPGIWLDLQHAMDVAVHHLVGRGHRRLGFYAPQGMGESPSVAVRQEMFAKACQAVGVAAVCVRYDGESWDLEAAAAGARQNIRLIGAADAFVGFNDVAALGLLMATGGRRKKPLVLCFDGTSLARAWPGSPPCFDLRLAELARRAVVAAVAEKAALSRGRRAEWLRPELKG